MLAASGQGSPLEHLLKTLLAFAAGCSEFMPSDLTQLSKSPVPQERALCDGQFRFETCARTGSGPVRANNILMYTLPSCFHTAMAGLLIEEVSLIGVREVIQPWALSKSMTL